MPNIFYGEIPIQTKILQLKTITSIISLPCNSQYLIGLKQQPAAGTDHALTISVTD